jgi:hypothetical protein
LAQSGLAIYLNNFQTKLLNEHHSKRNFQNIKQQINHILMEIISLMLFHESIHLSIITSEREVRRKSLMNEKPILGKPSSIQNPISKMKNIPKVNSKRIL